ncbi:DUF3054 domain-containing protein [Leucobacter chinensis]|uniref:DUF3054 domain-containing protein n=1 Tax=Leucobacter chinensis TaxID=2851010 RepID=UPI001C23BCB3|nr:DUF3054 domain-containing protein [Leucobacter chinensis]
MNARSVIPAFVLDAVLVCIFAALGRNSHTMGMSIGGVLTTAWPFLAGLAVSWAASLAWRAPLAPIRTGLPLWIGTVGIGMLLRSLTGAGTAFAFVLVATGTLGVMLVGWRALSAMIRQGKTKTPQR